jgi:hypothetical protein
MADSYRYGDDGDRQRELGEEAVRAAREAELAVKAAAKYLSGAGVPADRNPKAGHSAGSVAYETVMFAAWKVLEAQAIASEAAATANLNAVESDLARNPPKNPLLGDAKLKHAQSSLAQSQYQRANARAMADYHAALREWEKNGGSAESKPRPPTDDYGNPPPGSELEKLKKAADVAKAAADEAIKKVIESGDEEAIAEILIMYDCSPGSASGPPPGIPPSCRSKAEEECPDEYRCEWVADGEYDPGASKGKAQSGSWGRATEVVTLSGDEVPSDYRPGDGNAYVRWISGLRTLRTAPDVGLGRSVSNVGEDSGAPAGGSESNGDAESCRPIVTPTDTGVHGTSRCTQGESPPAAPSQWEGLSDERGSTGPGIRGPSFWPAS